MLRNINRLLQKSLTIFSEEIRVIMQKGNARRFWRDGDRAGQSFILRNIIFEMPLCISRHTGGRQTFMAAVCSRQSVGRELVAVILMRSGTSPREPYEIANFDPIHARVTTPVFPISIFVDLSRSTARHAIGVSLFLLPFFFSFSSRLRAQLLRVGDDDFSFALRDDDVSVCGNRNRWGVPRIYIPRLHFQFFFLQSRCSRVLRRDLSATNCTVFT